MSERLKTFLITLEYLEDGFELINAFSFKHAIEIYKKEENLERLPYGFDIREIDTQEIGICKYRRENENARA